MASRRTEDLCQEMQAIIPAFEADLELVVPGVFKRSCTFRSPVEQKALYMRGRNSLPVVNDAYGKAGMAPITEQENQQEVTWTLESKHTIEKDGKPASEAVDYFIQRDGKYCNDLKVDTDGDEMADWDEFGVIAARHGLVWGGTWKKKDIPHVELRRA